MRILLIAPDYATDARSRGLARGLVGSGHAAIVIRAADEVVDEQDDGVRVLGRPRTDPCPTHWMREGSVEMTRWLRGVLLEHEPEVLHVAGWTRLTSDPVLTAARAGVPAVVEMFDHRSTCLLSSRRRPESGEVCTRTYGPYECVSCAAQVPPPPTWVSTDRAYLAFGERAAALGRELALARARLIPNEQHGEDLVRALGSPLGPLIVVPPPGDPDWVPFHEELYQRVIDLGRPAESETGQEAWFEERMRAAAESVWDEGARAADANPG